jgi:serine/threonine-protein kinase HipA
MVDVAEVRLYNQVIGFVRWDSRYDVALFQYDTDFSKRAIEPSPLMMPVREGRV